MPRFIRKPEPPVEGIQVNNTNWSEVRDFAPSNIQFVPDMWITLVRSPMQPPIELKAGDWVIRESDGALFVVSAEDMAVHYTGAPERSDHTPGWTDAVMRLESKSTGLSYEEALIAMKDGHRAAREGWNGKAMWICIGEGQQIGPEKFWNKHTRAFATQRTADGKGLTTVLPYFIMKTADDSILMGWLASQSDMLSSDWCILKDEY